MTTIGPKGSLDRSIGREILAYRDLVVFLARRDIKVRYQQALLGAAWAFLQPLLFMAIFTVVFSRIVKASTGDIPYPLFAFSGLIIWQLFINSVTSASNSVVSQQNMVQKIYFPRLVLPLSACVVTFVDFLIASVFLLGMTLFFGFFPSWRLIAIVPIVLLTLTLAFGVGSALAALNVRFRDIRYLTNFIAQLWLFATPVAYPFGMIPEKWTTLASFNPVTGLVEAFRWATIGSTDVDPFRLSVSIGMCIVLSIGGIALFRTMEPSFADTI
ncbi:ABC transporter permease [Novosphingobium mangrovi (ex Huang et al. 2023)]|uniref:Transport permease protein n=1 Tax=Novosphingobium mangrovi (ex Huang et al. 2023) TaxID=2976432 RepID=A0ABT2I9M4_9SPHN|nr:ABC transporter permease [Novosphingobium mangrovi (ex Huang et al. 2023)]MCT2401508.1 ABC transporter permease [Novosphingobium mangrovi (ex Huang et al. 2023)]